MVHHNIEKLTVVNTKHRGFFKEANERKQAKTQTNYTRKSAIVKIKSQTSLQSIRMQTKQLYVSFYIN